MNYSKIVMGLALCLLLGCKPTQVLQESPAKSEAAETKESEPEVVIEDRDLEELTVTATREKNFVLPKYNPSFSRANDLIHTKLDVRFDWKKQHVLGKATLDFKPLFYSTNTLVLDAKGFDIHKVALSKNGQLSALKYNYDNDFISIQLDKKYTAKEKYKIYIEYTAKPNEYKVGGSAAITQDKGLYFINPSGENKEKPQQIWTQGETESNSKWFPTIDKPNERCTQEIYVTVRDDFKTLSNGELKTSTKNGDGTRTDYWVMGQPHAPYLFMLAIGDYAIVKDTWKGKEVGYYVEPKYKDYARDIFPHTVEMIEFFSKKLNYDYPWNKYSQVVVRDYVSGAMENTTGVIYGEFMNGTDRELIDVTNNQRIVAHELFHHWFGDLVTCESWANLPMNESFANYGEYLWFEHKMGRDAADYHLMTELSGYLSQAGRGNIHQLIYFDYNDKEQTFDAHSYNKGGCILHMLRTHVGDEAFFTALNTYLNDNKYTAVEAHDLRLAFEEVTGQDFNWFFNQWFFAAGHPVLEVAKKYDEATKKLEVTLYQTQDPEKNPPIFQLPLAIDIYENGTPTRHEIWMNQRKQVFSFDVTAKPDLVNIDAEKILVGIIKDEKSTEEYIHQFYHAPTFLDRYEAISSIGRATTPEMKKVYVDGLKDKFWVVRAMAVEKVEGNFDAVAKLAVSDKHSQVRAAAMEKLGESGDTKYVTTIKDGLKDRAFGVIAASLKGLRTLDNNAALKYAQILEKEESESIITTIASMYAESKDPTYLSFYENNWQKINGFRIGSFMRDYITLLVKAEDKIQMGGLEKLKGLATNLSNTEWKRYGATRAINDMRSYYKALQEREDSDPKYEKYVAQVTAMIDAIKANETNEQLKRFYGMW